MAELIFNKIKVFNLPKVEMELLAALSSKILISVQWNGFEPVGERLGRLRPFSSSTREIGRTDVGGVETIHNATRGDIRVITRQALRPAQVALLEVALDTHDATIDTPEQERRRQTTIDVRTLRAIYDAGITNEVLRLTIRLVLLNNGEDI